MSGRTATRKELWVLGLASAGSFIVILDMLVVATALTTIQRDLGTSIEGLEWTVNSYTLSCAVFLMSAAALGDRFGRRRVYAVGLGLFAVASIGCALAPNIGVLIAARSVQGAGAAAVLPLALALLNATIPPDRRGWAMGIYGSVTGLSVVVGPVLGGAVTQGIAWQWIFWLNVPVAAGAIVPLFARVAESRGPSVRIDIVGLALITAAAFGVVWGLVRGNAAGWASPETLASIGAGLVAAGVFVAWERRTATPMLPPRLFRSRAFTSSNVAIFLVSGAITGAVFFTAQFFQVALGEQPLAAGVRLLPWGIAPLLLAPGAGALSDRIGVRPLMIAGLSVETLGLAWLAAVASPTTGYAALVGPITASGAGLAIAIPAITKCVVSAVPLTDVGKASGSFATMRQLGGAFGVAILAAVFARTGGYGSAQSFADGFSSAMAVGAGLAAVGAVASLAVPRSRSAAETAAGREPLAAATLPDSRSLLDHRIEKV